MAAPAGLPNPGWEVQDFQSREAYVHGHDADGNPEDVFSKDAEKGVKQHTHSTHSDERTLSSDLPIAEADETRDPNIVDWEGPDDPANPQNWPIKKKWGIIAALGAVSLITPLASSFFAPGVPQVLHAFHETSKLMAAFVVSVYILGFAIGPLIIAPMSELYGRIPLYNIANLLFVVFNIGCAASNSMGMLIAFRFLAGCAGAAPLTLGGGTIADMFPPEQRAGAMAIWASGPLLGPVIGPVCGGFLVEHMSWRWVFWIMAIFGGAFGILLLIVGRETNHPTLLDRKTARLRKETGNENLRSKLAKDIPPRELFIRAIFRPMKMLFLSPIVSLMSLYIAINYGILYLFFTTITFVFEGKYHFSSGAVGLSYIGVGVGMIVGMAVLGVMSDKIIKQEQAKGDAKPEHRLLLKLTLPGAISLPIGVFVYGWTTFYGVHWIVPIIATSFIGLGNLTAMMTIQTYLVDAFTVHAASAIAANTVLRSIFGALLPLSGLSMYDALGLGWGNTLLGFISLACHTCADTIQVLR
ncbi:MFS general substrate transporter [Cucurbitaria berberidis CBS 394.84]|uniref:MFS general substrate transporter n=1 Tax=Cucurbitaria berberidis CBS 394.84 TaxID=1168544 RepID=A0A9P4GI36_9PLEO|nr:MFS general substrate transporter [Cucurbitaria berberidis CBS 394.84]KAF1845634.1 MFS general substrate transporter [Cucurbitaria berberidis CBS 394.84]